ncbi:lactose-binding lectin l-2-like [Patiria miniata]|uniref:C-type lectin domain-containing protein n=1 Tax=Patiria miniata TaxID=46514 RepID=A0A914B588_PATMI|nr:lactose-binding lectin l-2-like [Patiria miniata]
MFFEIVSCVVVSLPVALAWSSGPCPIIADGCPSMWQHWNDSCYRLTADGNTYNASLAACQDMGGKMAAPRSHDENQFVSSLALSAGQSWVWLACDDRDVEGTWHCNGQELTGETYENWYGGEPNNSGSNEDCAQLNPSTTKWNDISCEHIYRALCIQKSRKIMYKPTQ